MCCRPGDPGGAVVSGHARGLPRADGCCGQLSARLPYHAGIGSRACASLPAADAHGRMAERLNAPVLKTVVGGVAEWSIAPVLKTGNGQPFVSSNLTASANKNKHLA